MPAKASEVVTPLNVYCDFCGRTGESVGTLVRGIFGVHICEQCTSDVMELFEERRLRELEREVGE
jgi:hypothetical protein